MKRRKLPRYVSAFTTKTGRARYQFRRKGQQRYYVRAKPWTDAFMDEYRACMSGASAPHLTPGIDRSPPGSLSALIAAYYGSAKYQQLADSTKATYRRELERLRQAHGTKRVALIGRKHVAAMIDAKAALPGAANNLLRMLRILMAHAVAMDWRKDDPTAFVERLKTKGGGFHTGSEEEVAQYEARHPSGSMARLALALMLYTGSRRSDTVALGRQHIRDGRISVCQQKTKKRLRLPIHQTLSVELRQIPADRMTFLQTAYARPFKSGNSFYNWFKERCREAGVPHCSPHGLRKLISTRLAEAGATPHQIQAITGHASLKEVERYTRAASQKRLSDQAMNLIDGTQVEQELSPLENLGDKSAEKAFKNKA